MKGDSCQYHPVRIRNGSCRSLIGGVWCQGQLKERITDKVFSGTMIYLFVCLSQDSQTKLFTPAAPRPSPDGAGESNYIDPGGTGLTTVG